ncbi:uncharacterized protein LOC125656784 isoform X1 [Ostrea edulis]|uniref:uncharacterized protein LOC125656784 isoform X1 n=1 Tax=Ostrea edulis TaxID=37623 RepID=UPI0024AFC903|nr:uncharacterized protein LOC125656784 isoform X1 [Ostrea edulis]
MTGIVESCPTSLTEVIASSARLSCGEDEYGNNQYLCIPNTEKTGLVEFCHKGGIPLTTKGFCLKTKWRQLYYSKCQHFINGCPSKPYHANEIYKYPACLNINTESQCFLADPTCPNMTSRFTTNDMMETPSTYFDFSDTTVNPLYNTTDSLDDVSTDIEAVVGGVLGGVFLITVLLILVFVVLRRRKKRKCTNRKGGDEENPLLALSNETKNRNKEKKNPPAESHETVDKEDNVPDEVKNQIKKRGIDFLSSLSSEHEKYCNGIAHILTVPVEVLGMPKEDIETFIRNYKKGSTKVYCGRGMVVGCFEAGKTTLVKKLKGEDVSHPPESTRGLDVHTDIFTVDQDETVLAVNKDQKGGQRLHINMETLESGVIKSSSNAQRSYPKADDDVRSATIPPPIYYTQPPAQRHENKYDLSFENNKPGTSTQKANDISNKVEHKSDTNRKYPVKHLAIGQITNNVANKTDENKDYLGHEIGIILPNVIDKSIKTISLLDFAGQDAYYACHHIFLSPRSFYILVTDMSRKLTEKPTNALQRKDLMYSDWTHQDYINHWLGSIHTYCSETAPVILVQSHSETKGEIEKDYFSKVLEGVTSTLHVHLSSDKVFAVEKDSDKNIKEIRSNMLRVVKDRSHWGESIPTSWVHLDAYLMEIKKHQMVLQKKDLWETLTSQPNLQFLSEEDMTTALRFFNDIGVILFTTSSESIILDVQWFVDAFKHIITDENHAKHDIAKHFTDWKKFNTNGILQRNLAKEIWKRSESFTKYTDDLVFYMIKLGMIAEMEKGEIYYVPCMNKQKYDRNVLHNCTCSSTVCFMFEYLPLVIFHRLVATCMTREGWKIWNGNNQMRTGQTSECVFHTAAILEDKDDIKVLIGITEKKQYLHDTLNTHPYSIEIQYIVFKDQKMQTQFARNKLETIKTHLKDLTSCFGANRDKTYRMGYRCSIAPFSDTPVSHIILQSAKECTPCRKRVDINYLRSFWVVDTTSDDDTFDIKEKKHERNNMDQEDIARRIVEYADNPSRNRGETTSLQTQLDNEQDHYTGDGVPNALHAACKNANLKMCEHLIQTHPDLLHSVDNDGGNAALHAAQGGNVNILQLLADNEVDVKHKNNYGWNILNVACVHSNLKMSRYIIQTYTDLLHNVDNDGWNAALHAARGGNVEILQLLADNGVDVKHKSSGDRDILNVACVHSNLEMSRYILQTYPDLLNSVDNDGWNAALHAAQGGNVKILQLLADNEVDVKHKTNDDRNILHVACAHSNLEISRYIIQTYPDLLHSVRNTGWNAALHAAQGGNVKILKVLAENGVDVKHQNNYNCNILHVACVHSNFEMSRYIIQTYPDLLHSVDKDGWNAALFAARGGNVKILQLLADNTVDVKHKENDGWNILNVACGHSNLEMSHYIIQAYPDLLHSISNTGWNAALHAAQGGNVKILKLLADNEVDVKHKDNHGLNILHVACVHSNLAMSHHIIQTYPDLLNSVNDYGEDAAILAAREGNIKIIQLLANHGVNA